MAETAPKKRRLQSGAACESCRKRRSRCDASRPQCSNCQIRSIPCEFPASQGPKRKASAITSASSTSMTDRSFLSSSPPSTESEYITINHALNSGSAVAGTYRPTDSVLSSEETNASQTYLGISSTFDFTSDPCRKDLDAIKPSYKQHQHWCGDETLGSSFELPVRDLADRLVDTYFNRTHKLYPFLHEGDFREEYLNMWQQTTTRYSRPPWFGVLNMVFAYGCESFSTEEALAMATPFVKRSKSIIMAHVFRASTVETIQALLLMCSYLQGTTPTECWVLAGLTIHTAMSLGLHLNPRAEKFSCIEREVRKRVWCGCFVLDRTLSMKFGRPPSIRLQDCEIEMPMEVDDRYIVNDAATPEQPPGTPSAISLFVSTIKLSRIVLNTSTELYLRDFDKDGTCIDSGGISQPFSPRCNHILSTVLLLDGQLQSWWDCVPDYLKREPKYPERSWVDLQSQRIVLKTRFLYVQLLIHRRTFLYFARHPIEDGFLQSVAIASAQRCIESARQTIQLVRSTYPQQNLHSLWYNAQYIFASLCVLGVLKKMDKEKRLVLDKHMDEHEAAEIHRAGMELLYTARRSSSLLAERYVAILERLQRDEGNEERTDTLSEHSAQSSSHLEAGHTNDTQVSPVPPDLTNTWTLNPPDPMFDNYFDLSSLDDLLFNGQSFGEFLPQATGNASLSVSY